MNLPLWDQTPPHITPGAEPDLPSLDVYKPFGTRFAGTAVLIFPGGGYAHRSEQEGEGFAGVFRLWGMTAFVCNYRVGSRGHRHPSMLEDAARAMRIIRSRAAEFEIHPERILAIGSSAGGHLAATLLTNWDCGNPDHADPVERVSSRPDLGALCYPVISLKEFVHEGSRRMLLGENPTAEQIEACSPDRHVTEQTPPTFLWHTVADAGVPVENSLLFASALRRSKVPFEMHLYQDGPHGLGMKNGLSWPDDLRRWIANRWFQ